MTFKSDIYQICNEVAQEFEGWRFTSTGKFKNKELKHTDLEVSPGFFFKNLPPHCTTSPMVRVENKKIGKLSKHIFGHARATLLISFRLESADYRMNTPGCVSYIYPENFKWLDEQYKPTPWPSFAISPVQAKAYLHKVLSNGISYIQKYLDLSSEENLLRNLPRAYRGSGVFSGWENDFIDSQGMSLCLAEVVLGNFDYVTAYASDDFKVGRPKPVAEIQKLLAALPELKKRYAETGQVI